MFQKLLVALLCVPAQGCLTAALWNGHTFSSTRVVMYESQLDIECAVVQVHPSQTSADLLVEFSLVSPSDSHLGIARGSRGVLVAQGARNSPALLLATSALAASRWRATAWRLEIETEDAANSVLTSAKLRVVGEILVRTRDELGALAAEVEVPAAIQATSAHARPELGTFNVGDLVALATLALSRDGQELEPVAWLDAAGHRIKNVATHVAENPPPGARLLGRLRNGNDELGFLEVPATALGVAATLTVAPLEMPVLPFMCEERVSIDFLHAFPETPRQFPAHPAPAAATWRHVTRVIEGNFLGTTAKVLLTPLAAVADGLLFAAGGFIWIWAHVELEEDC